MPQTTDRLSEGWGGSAPPQTMMGDLHARVKDGWALVFRDEPGAATKLADIAAEMVRCQENPAFARLHALCRPFDPG